MCSQMSVLAPSGRTIKEYVISFNLFLKNIYNGFQGRYLIWSVLLLKRYNGIPSLLREDNGFLQWKERDLHCHWISSEIQVQTIPRYCFSELLHPSPPDHCPDSFRDKMV